MQPGHPYATQTTPNPEYVSEHGTDLCVICKSDTGIPNQYPSPPARELCRGFWTVLQKTLPKVTLLP